MSKQIHFNTDARDGLKRGIDSLANAVKTTLGPKGRNVIIGKANGNPIVTKDGVTVAKEIEVADPLENMGAQMVKEVASKTADVAGDGTTTATVLAQAIVTLGMKNVAAGANPMDLKRGMDKAVDAVVDELAARSIHVSDSSEKLRQVATISANNDSEIGNLIADAITKVTKEGVITVEEAKGTETTVNIVEGMQIDKGYISPYFINNPDKQESVLENPYILLYDKRISALKEFLPLLEKVVQTGKSLLIIAEDVEGESLGTLVVNSLRRSIKVAAIKAPAFGDRRKSIMEDIATITGGNVISKELGHKLETLDIKLLGRAEKVIVNKDSTVIINGAGTSESIAERINSIKSQIDSATSDFDKEKLQERLAKLVGGVAVLYIGAATEVEMKEKKDRVDDALHATKAAIEEGIVPGGGVAYIRCISAIEHLKGDNEDETTGISIVKKALEEPLRQICYNAGVEGSVIIQKIKEGDNDFGYNARTDKFENLIESGVIDPSKVSRVALQNAVSIASMVLTSECSIVEIPAENKSEQNAY
jgi:chaperonin GroEL